MKIQCDVCTEEEATVYCTADEAALCSGCDNSIHCANKLAGKHRRFSLLHSQSLPVCDICQEKRAFLFCRQDRAILCKDCDNSIHKASEHTQKHNRFLLTGVKLSATSSLYSPSPTNSVCDVVPNLKIPLSPKLPANSTTMAKNSGKVFSQNKDNELTSVSQYLMEIPGWHFEDLLDSSPDPFGLTQTSDDLTIWDADLDSKICSMSSSESFGIWVPQAPTPLPLHSTEYTFSNASFGSQSKKRNEDSSFTVPQINPPSFVSKKSRIYW